MDRMRLERHILETYRATADRPWAKYPGFQVFRRADNQKWFALVMDVPKEKLGLPGGGALDVVNLKCGPTLVGSLLREEGFFPAYHMNKESWITVSLDGGVAEEKIELLLAVSYDATAGRTKKRKDGSGAPA